MTRYDPTIHHRRSIRLRGYDYRQAGAYFVTINTHRYEPILGAVVAGAMAPNAYGQIIAEDWGWLAETFSSVDLDACIVMPNHLHGIIVITETTDTLRLPLGRIVGAFKTRSTKHVNEWRETPGAPLWHRNYYEHIIRDDDDLHRIRAYILTNPARWSEESEHLSPPLFRTGDA